MRHLIQRPLLLAAAAATAVLLPAAGATADPADHADHFVQLDAGESASVQGGLPGGVNINYFGLVNDTPYPGAEGTCSKDAFTYCESVLIELTNPVPPNEDGSPGRDRQRLSLEHFASVEASDYDLMLFESDAEGTVGPEIGRSGGTPMADPPESIFTSVTTTTDEPTVYVIAHVVYFAAVSDYTLEINF